MNEAIDATPSPTVVDRGARFADIKGTYAGAVTRLIAYLIDAFAVGAIFAVVAAAFEYAVSALGYDLNFSDRPLTSAIIVGVWTFLYFTYPVSVSGRTLGKAIMGARIVRPDGAEHISFVRAAVRTLVTSLSFALFGLGLLLILVRKDRRALHDLIAGTAVVYVWEADQPSPTATDG